MDPNIRNFSQIEKLINESPKEADSQAFEWQRFLKTNGESSPELFSIETSEDFYRWAQDHPEKNIDPSVWVGKEISDAYYYLRNQHEDSQMRESGQVDRSVIPQDLAGMPLLATAFLVRPKIIEDDRDYQKIEENLKKEWLKKNNAKDFSSKEGLDYLYGSASSDTLNTGAGEDLLAEAENERAWAKSVGADLSTNNLAQDAENKFRSNPKFQKKLARYDKEAKKIYKNPQDDPKWWAHEQNVQIETAARLEILERSRDKKTKISKEDVKKAQEAFKKSQDEIGQQVHRKSQEEFALRHPEKAKVYFEKIEAERKKREEKKQPTPTPNKMEGSEGVSTPQRNTSYTTRSSPSPRGQTSQPSPRPHPSRGNGSRRIKAINKLMGRGIPNPLGKLGPRLALQAVRSFLTFLIANPWIWIVFGIIILAIVVGIIVSGAFGGAPGAPTPPEPTSVIAPTEIPTPTPAPQTQSPTSFPPTGDFTPEQAKKYPGVDDAIRNAVASYNLPRWFFYAIIQRESSFNPNEYNPNGGYGLTQLTGNWYVGMPYPENLNSPDDNSPRYADDMNFKQYGKWILMSQVSLLNNRLDPKQNIDRFATGFAVPAFIAWKNYYKKSDEETLRMIAFAWNKGVDKTYDPNNEDYLGLYDQYVGEFKGTVEAQDGIWNGKPILPAKP